MYHLEKRKKKGNFEIDGSDMTQKKLLQDAVYFCPPLNSRLETEETSCWSLVREMFDFCQM